jgi:predicted AlkP superfamily phosphohydrolase/phosphomutase
MYACATRVVVTAALTAVLSVPAMAAGRAVILGFDGMDPHLAQQMMDAGELPNFKKLQEQGGFQPLGSSNPPQSPTAWSSFSTSKTPFNHGIYDFLRRDPAKYLPGVGFGAPGKPKLNPDGSLAAEPEYASNRKGDSFWKVASDQGKKVKALLVPFAYPAEDLSAECKMLCGLTVPTIRGTENTYYALSEAFTQVENVAGGIRMPLRFDGTSAQVNIPGLAHPAKRGEMVQAPMRVEVDRAGKKLVVHVGEQAVPLAEGEWSEWVEWSFAVTPLYTVKAVSRFHAMAAGESVRLYMTCLQMDPREPYMRISSPKEFSKQLYERYGLYKTIGWAYETHGLKAGDITEEMFLQDVERTMNWRAQLAYDEIDTGNFDLLVAAWTATDRVSHMFWGYRDPKHPLYTPEMAAKYGRAVENTYQKADEIVGKVMAKLNPDDLLMVMSDHGFHSQRTNFSVNTWLVREGYLTVKGQTDAASAFNEKSYFMDFATGAYYYDWSKTKAYGIGLGMIFLNRQGREGQGIVSKEDAAPLLAEIRGKLLEVTDPGTGEKVFREVYVYDDPKGESVADAPDFQLGYAEGYQTDKDSAAGAAPKDVFSPNTSKWSGEHASSDVAFTQGILFSNKALAKEPSLIDLGVTALKYIGATPAANMEGRPLL